MRARFAVAAVFLPLSFAVMHARTPAGAGTKTAFISVVADDKGPQRDLTAQDFVVTEGKTARPVVEAELATMPLSVALLVDTAQPVLSTNPPTIELRAALAAFIKIIKNREPEAQIAFIPLAGAAVTEVDFTADENKLLPVVGRIVPDQRSQSVVLEGLIGAAKRIGERPAPRRALVVLDLGSVEGSADSAAKQVGDEVHRSGATVWSVSISSATAQTSALRDHVLGAVTQATGGLRLTGLDPSAMEAMMKRIANSLVSQYSVTFTRDGQPDLKALRFETKGGLKALLSPWMH